MKKVLFALMLLTQPALAREALLTDIVKPHLTRYKHAGKDNNSIEAKYHDSYFKHPKDAIADAIDMFKLNPKQVQHVKHEKSLVRTLARCVFYPKGAYGLHITPQQSLQMATAFVKDLNDKMVLSPDTFVVQGLDVDIVGSGCGVLLFSKLNNEFVLLTAVGHD